MVRRASDERGKTANASNDGPAEREQKDGADMPDNNDFRAVARSCLVLMEHQKMRVAAIRNVNRVNNASRAFVRRALGFRNDLPEAERTKINRKAAIMVKAILAGEEIDETGQKCAPFVVASSLGAAPSERLRDQVEKEMVRLAKTLPGMAFVKSVPGVGELGFAVIVGEAGSLSDYANPDKLRKRLGVAPKHSYPQAENGAFMVPKRRRGEMYGVIIEPLFKWQTMKAGPYRTVYDKAKASKEGLEDWPKLRAHRHGLMVMLDKFLVDLWCAWRGINVAMPAKVCLPAHSGRSGGKVVAENNVLSAAANDGGGDGLYDDKEAFAPAAVISQEVMT